MGIDCGTATTGWAILEKNLPLRDKKIKICEYGVVKTESDMPMEERLSLLYKGIYEILSKYKPQVVAVESLFYFKNQKTVISVGQARGVILLACAEANSTVVDYTPLQVKQAVSGYGKASKMQVQQMVKAILGLKEIPRSDDAADALAIAICHINSSKINAIRNL